MSQHTPRKPSAAFPATYLKLYPAATDADAVSSAYAYRSDSAMASARTLARLHTKTSTSKVYWYYFTHVSPFPQGLMWGGRTAQSWACIYGSEIVYVFDAFPLQDWAWRRGGPESRRHRFFNVDQFR